MMEMDHPFSFDVSCKVKEGGAKAAAEWLANTHSIGMIDAYKIVREAIRRDSHIAIFVHCGWDDIPRLQQALPEFAQQGNCLVSEFSYPPSSCPWYCDRHLLRYANSTCPVCAGTYISRVVDGRAYRV